MSSKLSVELVEMRIGVPVEGALVRILSESLILAQNERWRQASYMQVER